MSPLLKKLLINALEGYEDELDNCGCNDLFNDDPLIKDLSKKELKELFDNIKVEFPDLVKELQAKSVFQLFNTNITEYLIEKIKKL